MLQDGHGSLGGLVLSILRLYYVREYEIMLFGFQGGGDGGGWGAVELAPSHLRVDVPSVVQVHVLR